MKGYKIHYGEIDHDCWGAREWCGWYDYDNVTYLKYESAEKIMEDAQEQFPYKDWEIYEIEILE